MPILLVALLALFGIGWFARGGECPMQAHCDHAAADPVEPARIGALPEEGQAGSLDDLSWASECAARLAAAAEGFEKDAAPGCTAGEVSVSRLPSGVVHVEYALHTPDGVDYQVAVTEEPQNEGEPTGWVNAPGCKGYDSGFETVRHENGRLARVHASGGKGLSFAQAFESPANFCVEQAR